MLVGAMMSKSRKYQATAAAISLLCEHFPQAFVLFEQRRRPLKVGIYDDIAAVLDGAITKNELANALRVYCGNSAYLHATRAGAARIGLDGKPAGVVSESESEHAKERLKAREAAAKERQEEARHQPRKKGGGASTRTTKVSGKARDQAAKPPKLTLADLKMAAVARRMGRP
jgi:ProP effector